MRSTFKSAALVLGALVMTQLSLSQARKDHSTNKTAKQTTMENNKQTEANKAAVRSLYEEILNTRQLDKCGEIIGNEYTGVRGEKGPTGFLAAVGPVIEAFPDVLWTIEDLVAADDKVVVRWSWKGTNKNSFNGFPATGKEVTNSAIAIYQLKAGKVVQAWMQSDRLGFLEQIGVIPAEQVAPRVKK